MAIGYEPMQPMDEKVYQSYGAAMAREKDRDFALRAGAQAQQSAHQSSQLAQQDEHFVEQQRQQAGLAREHMNQQAAMQDSQQAAAFAMQHDRQNFEFTQADNLQLQKLNQDAASWQQLHDNGDITDKEFVDGQTMIRNRQMPFQAQRDATEQRHRQQANAQLAQQTAAITAMGVANANFQSQALPNSTIRHRDDDGNLIAITHPNGQGGFHTINVRSEGAGAGGTPKPMTEAQVANLRVRLTRQVDSDPAWMGRPESARRARVAELETLARQQASGENLPPAQPITATTREEESALPAYQRQGLRDLESLNNTLNATNSGLTDEQRREVRRDFDLAQNLFRQYGGLLEMPSTERRSFSAAMRSLTQLNDQVTARGRARPSSTRPPPVNYSGPVDNARPGDANYASPYGQ